MWVPLKELLRAPAASFTTIQSPLIFHSQGLWGLTFLTLESWAGGPGVGIVPLTPELPLRFLSTLVWGKPIPCLFPLLPIWMGVVSSIL